MSENLTVPKSFLALAGEPPKVKAPVTSPTSLRLGLSRNVRLKPLHASLKTK